MRCINMKIIEILLFLLNLMTIKSVSPPKDKTGQTMDKENLNKFERDCPDLWKVIQHNNLAELTNCQSVSQTSGPVTEEKVLQFACFLAKNIMMVICDHKLNMTSEYLKLGGDDQLCPFQFSHLHLHLPEVGNFAKELTSKNQCVQVCYDLYEPRIQCVILNKLNHFLKNYEEQSRKAPLVLPNEGKSSATHTSTLQANKIGEKSVESKPSNETTTEDKMETTSNKDATSPVEVLSTSETKKSKIGSPKGEEPKLKKPESERPKTPKNLEMSKNDQDILDEEDKDFKTKTKFLNSEAVENDNALNSPPNPPKDEVNGLADLQEAPWEGENRKVQVLFNQKEINSNDGFLQAEDSHFFFYFIMVSSIIVIGYIGFHNKNKILAYALEGTSGRRSRRRPNPARYRKLETNLEEAISSNASETVASSVVY